MTIKYNVYKPFEWQIDPLRDKSPVILLTGGSGGGKSRCGYEKLHAFMLRYPNAQGLILRKDKTSLKNSVLINYDTQIIRNDKRIVKKISNSRYEYWNGSKIAWAGMIDQKQKEALKSIGQTGGVDFCVMEEANAFLEEDFNMVLTRMRGTAAPWTQVILLTNPDKPAHWINMRLIKGGEASVYFSKAEDNPTLPQSYFEALDKLTGVDYKRYRLGMWVKAEGVIYEDFNAEIHVIDDSFLLPELRFYSNFWGGADSNYTKPRAGLVFLEDKDGNSIVWDEFYEEKTGPEMLRDWYVQKSRECQHQIMIYHDPADPQAIDIINAGAGISCDKALNPVIPGINLVAGKFKNKKLFIHKRCVNLISELESYAWKKGKEGEVIEKNNTVQDHACFIGDTMIETVKGKKRIADIKNGEFVLTRKGFNCVSCKKITNMSAKLIKIRFSNGKSLVCTPDHPIYSIDKKKFIRADTLRYLNKVVDSFGYLWNQKYLMDEAITKAKMGIGERVGDSIIYTEIYGNTTKERSQRNIKYITKMAIRIIMKLIILNAYLLKNMQKGIQNNGKETKNILKKYDHLQKNGIKAKKEEKNIPKFQKNNGKEKNKLKKFANSVVQNIKLGFQAVLNFVISTVDRQTYVVGVENLNYRLPVYNISVENEHEYFANDILVSNCDALRYGIYSREPNKRPVTIGRFY